MNNNHNDSKQYQWKIASTVPSEITARFPEWNIVTAQLLYNRQLTTQEDVDHFVLPDYGQDQHDPFLFRDMKKVVARIKQAVLKKQKIVIHGDYDADGVCGSAVLYKTLQKIGADVSVYLPHRDTEGYGLNLNTIQTLADAGTHLVITVDCGTSNKKEIAKAVELGMDVIVTDHHSEPPELPKEACAMLNPKLSQETYPFRFLAGVGVSFKLCQALIREYALGEAFEKWLLDLVAISTVTDFVPLIGENRVFVKYGLVVMKKNLRPGLRQLFSQMNVEVKTVSCETILFKVGPHINAAGRMKHANAAFEMLVEENEEQAALLAANIVQANKERQRVSAQMSKRALEQAELQKNEFVIIVEIDDCPIGLVGLVAGKVASTYHRPTFVVGRMGEEIAGSGRSIEQFDLIDHMHALDRLFAKYGGHPMACGFTIKNAQAFEQFKAQMRERASAQLASTDLRKILNIEMVLELSLVDWKLIDVVEQFSPYGEGNPEPTFVSYGVRIEDIAFIGKNSDHVRLVVSQGNVRKKCIGFGFGKEWYKQLHIGDIIDVTYHVGVNEWNGNREIQLLLQDIQKNV